MELSLVLPGGESSKEINVSATIFGRTFNEALVHQVITAQLAGSRSGTSAQKTRAEVRGGGKKPWKQKGMGRARAGTIRSPLWRGGGKTFAAVPRDYSQKVNKKMYRGAMKVILSELIRQDRLLVVESFTIETPKTQALIQKLGSYGLKEALIITDNWDDNLFLSSRNVPKVEVWQVSEVRPVSLVKFKKIIMTLEAIRKLEEVLK